MLILSAFGTIDISLNLYFMIKAYITLDSDANEVWIMILCVFLCEVSIYSRYLGMSYKAKLYSHLLKDFEEQAVKNKQQSLEEAVKANLNNKQKKTEDLKQLFLATPTSFRRKLIKSNQNSPKNKVPLSINTSQFENSPEKPSITHEFERLHQEEMETRRKVESQAMLKLWSSFRIKDSLKLGSDFYSLAFYGFYLEDDEEELSAHNDLSTAKRLISKQESKPSFSSTPRRSFISEI